MVIYTLLSLEHQDATYRIPVYNHITGPVVSNVQWQRKLIGQDRISTWQGCFSFILSSSTEKQCREYSTKQEITSNHLEAYATVLSARDVSTDKSKVAQISTCAIASNTSSNAWNCSTMEIFRHLASKTLL